MILSIHSADKFLSNNSKTKTCLSLVQYTKETLKNGPIGVKEHGTHSSNLET